MLMKLKLGGIAFAVVALAALLAAQNAIDGKWTGEVQGGRGPQTITITFKADGGTLTGTITGGRGGEVQIKDGTISGTAIKFKSTQMGRGGEINLSWSGTLKGDEIAMTRTVEGGQGQSQEFTLKRQK
jgi:opacity protein-like surface antigen